MSFESLDILLTTVWHSLDDIFVCVGFFLAANVVASSVQWSLLNYFRSSHYTAQITHFGFLFMVFIFLVGHLIGSDTATSLFSGFSIGFGYAMQPYIVSLLAGATFRSGSMFRAKDLLRINGQDYTLEHTGLLYLCASSDGYKTYFPNSMLAGTPIGVKPAV
jgi:small-conductance mechanosensitive channel